MYVLAIRRDFIAQHFLIGGDWGAENQKHSHHYLLEARLEGDSLDPHGYLVDIVDLDNALDRLVSRYRDQTLNDQVEFTGLNPSLEHFSRILCQALAREVQVPNIRAVTLRLWENEVAWASYRQEK